MNNPTLEKPTVNTELPSPLADIHDRVMEAYYGKLGDQFMRETQSRIHWICAQVKGRRILDVGCSQGIVPLLLAREGCQVTGVDTSPQAIEEAKGYLAAEPAHIQQNVTYINSDFLALDTLEVEPDTVVISEVLEHLVRPELFVEKAYDLLKPGGRLVITVPFGVNDFIDHKHTFYLMEPFRLLAEHLHIIEVKMLGKWLGIVAIKSEAHNPGTLDSLTVERVRELEKAFESIERTLRGNLGAISKRLDEANKKYRTATEQIAKLKPEAQKAEALSKQLQTRDVDIANLQKSNREVLEAKTQRIQELEEIRQRLDEANKKYRAATEQIALLKPEAQKADALALQVKQLQLELETQLSTTQNELQHAQQNCEAQASRIDQLSSTLSTRSDELQALQQQYHSTEEQLRAITKQLAAAEGQAAKEAASFAALQAQHHALESEMQKLSNAHVLAQKTNDTHVENITALRGRQVELEAQLESQAQHSSNLLAQSQQKIDDQTNINAALRTRQAELEAEMESELEYMCGFHAIRPPSPLSSGQAFQGHLATCSTAIRPGSRSAATQGWHC
ncbi:methyltransferase domain-containing protein [Pseudomonas putida]|uniref:methyltransferase domain-containing protein n=1 Tax=Pseudomonas putida TaxID=303 RepID=UPI002DBA4D72|nr:methyltransferase domain-containing protein [Pseudomonas putida]WRW02404.1 methyltransferase domain-containing protein [Pseudomonas putida]